MAGGKTRGRPEPDTSEEGIVSRRGLLRWAMWGSVLLGLTQFFGGFINFFWPRKVGAFGGQITAGKTDEFDVGSITKFPDGKFYVSHVDEGLLAMYWRCTHLGCTVPWKPDEGQFHCPCHGSRYNKRGVVIGGPAPRPLDLMELKIVDGKVVVNTGKITKRFEWDPSQATPVG